MNNNKQYLNNDLWMGFNRLMQKEYNFTCDKYKYAEFINYCQQEIEVSGVKPIVNPINLYAYCVGISSEEVKNHLMKKRRSYEQRTSNC